MLPDPITIRCDLCRRFGRYSQTKFFQIAGTSEPTSALPRFAAAMGCQRAKNQLEQFSMGSTLYDERCQVIYVLPDAQGPKPPTSEGTS